MNDDVKAALKVVENSHLRHDPDWRVIRAHLDAEPARLAAAREEQREACAVNLEAAIGRGKGWAINVRATPITATPLADEITALRARVAELEAAGRVLVKYNNNKHFDRARAEFDRAEKAEAERDRARERLALQVGIAVKTPLPLLDLVAHAERLLMETRAERDALREALQGLVSEEMPAIDQPEWKRARAVLAKASGK